MWQTYEHGPHRLDLRREVYATLPATSREVALKLGLDDGRAWSWLWRMRREGTVVRDRSNSGEWVYRKALRVVA